MTQIEQESGVLKYNMQNEKKNTVESVRTDGKYTNIAWDDIDIEKKYRVAVGIYVHDGQRCKYVCICKCKI